MAENTKKFNLQQYKDMNCIKIYATLPELDNINYEKFGKTSTDGESVKSAYRNVADLIMQLYKQWGVDEFQYGDEPKGIVFFSDWYDNYGTDAYSTNKPDDESLLIEFKEMAERNWNGKFKDAWIKNMSGGETGAEEKWKEMYSDYVEKQYKDNNIRVEWSRGMGTYSDAKKGKSDKITDSDIRKKLSNGMKVAEYYSLFGLNVDKIGNGERVLMFRGNSLATGTYDLNFEAKTSDFDINSMFVNSGMLGGALKLAGNVFNFTPLLDMAVTSTFNGMKSLEFNLKTYLDLEEWKNYYFYNNADLQSENGNVDAPVVNSRSDMVKYAFVNPLMRLLGLMLPSRDGDMMGATTDFFSAANSKSGDSNSKSVIDNLGNVNNAAKAGYGFGESISKWKNSDGIKKFLGKVASGLVDILDKNADNLQSLAGETYFLRPAFPFTWGGDEITRNVTVRIGNLVFNECLVKKVAIRFPECFYTNGIPSYLDVDIDIISQRMPTTGLAYNIFSPANFTTPINKIASSNYVETNK